MVYTTFKGLPTIVFPNFFLSLRFQIVICQPDLSIFCSFFSFHNCTILKNSPFSSINLRNLHKVTQTLRDQSIFKQIKQELRFHIVLLFYS